MQAGGPGGIYSIGSVYGGSAVYGATSVVIPQKFKPGDKVVLITDRHGISTSNPFVKQPEFSEVVGVFTGIHSGGQYLWRINWNNGEFNTYDESDLELYDVYQKEHQKKQKEIDLSHLEKVIVDKKVKDEISSVLKQHKHAAKIFDEWGIGDVLKYGKGMSFLFHGKPGTGKTWMAQCIADALGKDLLQIGPAEIQTQEPGGANRNIQNAFKSAKNKVLFIDECDGLITNRQSVGMILGGEINTLLTEIEKFDGVCILATNMIENLDEALERRISLIVEFPEPNVETRIAIWKTLLPKKLPLAKDVSVEKLAEYKLTGGLIKNAILNAARAAAANECTKVELKHFEGAIERIIKSKSLMGKSPQWNQKIRLSDYSVDKTR